MPAMTMPMVDPLRAFIDDACADRGEPIPLVSTRFDVDIDGGLVTVVTKRVFRNEETRSIEAAITFLVPVHAVLFNLEACIDGRAMKAWAQRHEEAREEYEDAIEDGKTAVLHEEVLRGVHMLSVGHLGPGKEIEVTTAFAATLGFVGDQARLRIPLTVGDVYGRSRLPDSDDLMTGGPVQVADLSVRCRNGAVAVRDVQLEEGRTRVALNAPIDLIVTGGVNQELHGVAADGREVVLRIAPHRGGDMALNVAVLVDRSGSMHEVCCGQIGRITKHKAITNGLKSVAKSLGEDDSIDLWEFDDTLAHVGSSHDPASPKEHGRKRLLSLIARLRGPAGGTEIGDALSGTMAASTARDVLLITDGKSYEIDVHELARKGRRITVVLVGEDSLEANVGYLAALSGGDIFIAADGDIAGTLAAAIGSLRAPSERPGPIEGPLERIRVVRGNALLEAEWRPATGAAVEASWPRSVAAMAASLALPVLDEERAAVLAEAEGLVTHLTSLVLVDVEGEAQEGIPGTRKIALPAPNIVNEECRALPMDLLDASDAGPHAAYSMREDAGGDFAFKSSDSLGNLQLDWDTSPNLLLAGDLSALDPQDAWAIELAATEPKVIALAKRMNVAPTALVVALIAHSQASENRSAARIAKAVLDQQFKEELLEVAMWIGFAGFDLD